MQSDKEFIQLLIARRHRITPARRKVIEILVESLIPLSAAKIHTLLEEVGLKVNKTTVYRELEFLKNNEIVKEVYIRPGKIYYESTHHSHHHHLTCTDCGLIKNIECSEMESQMDRLKKEVRDNGFVINEHNLEFYGKCVDCK